jgi:predicted transcriptional regulator
MDGTSVRLGRDVLGELEEEARRQHLSAAQIANEAIRAYLDNQALKREAVQEALAEADKGVFISSEAMHRWIKSWGTANELPPPEPDVFVPRGSAGGSTQARI